MRDIQVWHEARARGEDARRPSPLALGKDAFVGEMWRWVWDLRGDIPVPAAMTGRAHDGDFAVNAERLELLLTDCIDKELLSFIRAGVLMKADLDPQIVIFPSLLSLYDVEGGVDAVAREYAEQERRGWYEKSNFIPFAPYGARTVGLREASWTKVNRARR